MVGEGPVTVTVIVTGADCAKLTFADCTAVIGAAPKERIERTLPSTVATVGFRDVKTQSAVEFEIGGVMVLVTTLEEGICTKRSLNGPTTGIPRKMVSVAVTLVAA